MAFIGNKTKEFNVDGASCEEPVNYLEPNSTIEHIAFAGIETFVKLTVGDSVTEGTYLLTFDVSVSMLRSYIYFSVGKEIEVDDVYDTNAVAAYVNADIKAGANNTVGAGTSNHGDWDEDFSRTVTLKAGDVIYLATTAVSPGYVNVTLTPVDE